VGRGGRGGGRGGKLGGKKGSRREGGGGMGIDRVRTALGGKAKVASCILVGGTLCGNAQKHRKGGKGVVI